MAGLALGDKRGSDFSSALGDDRHLDGQVWVGPPFSHLWPGHEVTDVWDGRYHNNWEFWAYNAAFGFFQAPYYSYSQTVMAELTPPGFSYMVSVFCTAIAYTLSGSLETGRAVLRPLWND